MRSPIKRDTLRGSLLTTLLIGGLACTGSGAGTVTGSAGSSEGGAGGGGVGVGGSSGGTTGGGGAGDSVGSGATGGSTGAGDTGGTGTAGDAGTTGGAGTTGMAGAGGGNAGRGGSTGGGGAAAGTTGSGGRGGTSGGTAGTTGSGGAGGSPAASSALVTSASGTYWKTGTWTESTATANVTVNDANTYQTWEGFGGAFNEKGWSYLTSQQMKDQALALLFGKDGCNFAWGRIPIGASDYAMDRYSLNETAGDTSMSMFSVDRDLQKLIPYIKAAQAVKSDIRFWASPWTPPTWMKTGPYNPNTGASHSNFDGGVMKSDDATLKAFALYLVKFVQAYAGQGINVEVVSPQNEPNYQQNYPSCHWDTATFVSFVGKYLGPALTGANLATRVMDGTTVQSERRRRHRPVGVERFDGEGLREGHRRAVGHGGLRPGHHPQGPGRRHFDLALRNQVRRLDQDRPRPRQTTSTTAATPGVTSPPRSRTD